MNLRRVRRDDRRRGYMDLAFEIENSNLRTLIPSLLKQNVKVKYGRMKIVLLGEGRTGKTCTLRSLLGEKFNPGEKSTIAGNFSGIKISSASMKAWKREVNDKDIISNDFCRYAKEIRADDNHNVIKSDDINLQVKVDDKEISENIDVLLEKGNQSSKEEGTGKQEPNKGLNQKEEELLNVSNFSVWDFGGQKLFSALHHLYITEGAVYLQVFSIENFIEHEKRTLAELESWLRMIELHAPCSPIIIIGTRAGDVDWEVLNKINLSLIELLNVCRRDCVAMNEKDNLCFFPVENNELQVGEERKEKFFQPVREQILECFFADRRKEESPVWK